MGEIKISGKFAGFKRGCRFVSLRLSRLTGNKEYPLKLPGKSECFIVEKPTNANVNYSTLNKIRSGGNAGQRGVKT